MLTFVPKIDELLDQIQLRQKCPSPLILKGLNFLPLIRAVGTMVPVVILKGIHEESIVTVENINELPTLACIIQRL